MRKRIEVPGPLHAQVAHAARFGRALDALLERTHPDDDVGSVWLVGRSSEVSAFVRDVVREWAVRKVPSHRRSRETRMGRASPARLGNSSQPMSAPFSDWPGPGPIDLALHDLPHASASTEWWYVNAHVETEDGRPLS